MNFTFLGNSTAAQLLGLEYSEAAGGSSLVRALAKHTRLGISEAQKLLKDTGDSGDFAKAELTEMQKSMNLLIDIVGPMDEFQIYGGASQLNFVYEAIDRYAQDHFTAINTSNLNDEELPVETARHVRRDFDPNHALVDATMHVVRREQNLTDGIPIEVSAKPLWTYYIDWGSQTEKYCQKNFVCRLPTFEFRLESNELVIRADPRQVHKNTSMIVNRYKLKNLTDIEFNSKRPGRLYVHLSIPEPIIEYVGYTNGSKLVPIEFQPMTVNQTELTRSTDYMKEVVEEMRQLRVKDEKIALLKEAVNTMDLRMRERAGNVSPDRKGMMDQILDQLDEYKRKLADGTYRRMSTSQLKRVIDEMEAVATVLGFDVK